MTGIGEEGDGRPPAFFERPRRGDASLLACRNTLDRALAPAHAARVHFACCW